MKNLTYTFETSLPFYDFDAMGILWHGNYIKYMEQAREAFLSHYALTYKQMFDYGYAEPVTNLQISYKASLIYGDTLVMEITYKPSLTAKLAFEYKFYRKKDMMLMCEASTEQYFTHNGELSLNRPDFYKKWQEKIGVL